MKRAGIVAIEDVLPYVVMERPSHGKEAVRGRPERIYLDKIVKMDSLRYQTFVNSGIVCVSCGLQAEYFALEQHFNSKKPIKHERYHLNLYATIDMREIMFTKDHILPRARGGGNTLANLQTMCQPCNTTKGHRLDVKLDPGHAKTGRTSRNRVKRLRNKISRALAENKNIRGQHYLDGTPDGGPVFIQLKKRRVQLLKRLELLNAIDSCIKMRLGKLKRKTYGPKQEKIQDQRTKVLRLRVIIESKLKKNRRMGKRHYQEGTSDGGPEFIKYKERRKLLLGRLKNLTTVAIKLKREARTTERDAKRQQLAEKVTLAS